MQDQKEALLDKKEENKGNRREENKHEYDPTKTWIGYVFAFIAVCTVCTMQLLSKLIFTKYPDISAVQLLFLREAISSLIYLVMMNKNTVKLLIHAVPKQHRWNLASRVIQGIVSQLFLFTAIRYLPLVFVALAQNIAPLFTAVFSYILLRVTLNRTDLCILIVSFVGIVMLISGYYQDHQGLGTDPANNFFELIVPIICLLLVPVLMSLNQIMLRKMRKMNELTIGAYIALCYMIVFAPIIQFSGQGFEYIPRLDYVDWIVISGLGFTSAMVIQCRIKAVQYEEPVKTSFMTYFQSVIQFFIDVALLGDTFSFQQFVGIAIVFGANSIKLVNGIRRVCVGKGGRGGRGGKQVLGKQGSMTRIVMKKQPTKQVDQNERKEDGFQKV